MTYGGMPPNGLVARPQTPERNGSSSVRSARRQVAPASIRCRWTADHHPRTVRRWGQSLLPDRRRQRRRTLRCLRQESPPLAATWMGRNRRSRKLQLNTETMHMHRYFEASTVNNGATWSKWRVLPVNASLKIQLRIWDPLFLGSQVDWTVVRLKRDTFFAGQHSVAGRVKITLLYVADGRILIEV